MGKLVVEELWPDGAELGEVPLEGMAARLLEVAGTWFGGRELLLLRFVPNPNDDLKRELIRSI